MQKMAPVLLFAVIMSGCSAPSNDGPKDCVALLTGVLEGVKETALDANNARRQWESGDITDNKYMALAGEADMKINDILDRSVPYSGLCPSEVWGHYLSAWGDLKSHFGHESECVVFRTQSECLLGATDSFIEGLETVRDALQMAKGEAVRVTFQVTARLEFHYRESDERTYDFVLLANSEVGQNVSSAPLSVAASPDLPFVQENLTVRPDEGARSTYSYNLLISDASVGWKVNNTFRPTTGDLVFRVMAEDGKLDVDCSGCEWLSS